MATAYYETLQHTTSVESHRRRPCGLKFSHRFKCAFLRCVPKLTREDFGAVSYRKSEEEGILCKSYRLWGSLVVSVSSQTSEPAPSCWFPQVRGQQPQLVVIIIAGDNENLSRIHNDFLTQTSNPFSLIWGYACTMPSCVACLCVCSMFAVITAKSRLIPWLLDQPIRLV